MHKQLLLGWLALSGVVHCQEITKSMVEEMRAEFAAVPRYRAMQNALSQNDLRDIATNWDRYATTNHLFSHTISGELRTTDQKQSGRCWIFASLNLLRIPIARDQGLKNFELSQSYLFFWDKLEKANAFLDRTITTAHHPWGSRIVNYLFNPSILVTDGGSWSFAASLINKYGVVPQSVYPDNHACFHSGLFNQILQMKLLEQGARLRDLAVKGMGLEVLEEEKVQLLKEIYRILSMHLGTPPTEFDWEFSDKNGEFHAYRGLTPETFTKTFVTTDINDYVWLAHSPRSQTPYYTLYTFENYDNLIGGTPALFLNLPIEELKAIALAVVMNDEPVWCGCDVKKFFHRDLGVMDTKLYDLELVYDFPFHSTKEMRLNTRHSNASHVMLLTGVHIVDDKPARWRLENSWGSHLGDDGYLLMTDGWFDDYVFEIVVPKHYLSPELLPLFETSPIILPPWDGLN